MMKVGDIEKSEKKSCKNSSAAAAEIEMKDSEIGVSKKDFTNVEEVAATMPIELAQDKPAKSLSRQSANSKNERRRPWSTPASCHSSSLSVRSNGVDPNSLISHTMKLQDWLSAKNVRTVQEKADLETKETKQMYNSILDVENSFVKDIDKLLQYKDELNLRKKEVLHKSYSEKVHEPIRKKINRAMSGPSYVELDKRKRQLHKEYLEFTNKKKVSYDLNPIRPRKQKTHIVDHVNISANFNECLKKDILKKGHVFLDTYAPEEYYPLGLCPVRPYHIKAELNHLSDPVLNQERKRAEEDRTILHCITGRRYTDKDIAQIHLPQLPLVPLGRHGTECSTWLAMKLHDIESPVRKASQGRMHGDYNYSRCYLNNWAECRDRSVADGEMNLQHKRIVKGQPPCLSYPQMTNHMLINPLPGVTEMSIPPQNSYPFNQSIDVST
ncbi:protein FAM228B-like isoform X1 [Tubulanus polymorphus]|uniref:protein FAM228B-like isoform X1 n=1 Tax=Tubulanus polymorphus TaxID=672921 RepID=UPI003DA4D6C9